MSDNQPAGVQSVASKRLAVPRKKLHVGGARDLSIDVRLTRKEKAAVMRRAESLRIKPSAWVRADILDQLNRRRNYVDLFEPTLQIADAVVVSESVILLREAAEELR